MKSFTGNLVGKASLASSKIPIPYQFRPVLQRLRQVLRGDALAARQVGDGARQLEHAVVGARGQLELAHGRLHQGAAGIVQGAELAHLGRAHVGVAGSCAPGLLAKRSRCTCRAFSTRAWIAAEGSPRRWLLSLSYSTRGTSMWMSMRSSSGPEMRFW